MIKMIEGGKEGRRFASHEVRERLKLEEEVKDRANFRPLHKRHVYDSGSYVPTVVVDLMWDYQEES